MQITKQQVNVLWNRYLEEVRCGYGLESEPKNFLGNVDWHKKLFVKAVTSYVAPHDPDEVLTLDPK